MCSMDVRGVALSVCLYVCLSVCLSLRPPVCPSVCPFVCLSVCLSVHSVVCLFISVYHAYKSVACTHLKLKSTVPLTDPSGLHCVTVLTVTVSDSLAVSVSHSLLLL